MSGNSEYIKALIDRAKQGRKSQFLELSLEFLPRIYSIVFGLVPNMEAAKKVSAEVFYIIWKRINLVKSDSDFILQLKEIAIVRSFLYLQNVEKIELDGLAIQKITKGDPNFFTKVEREFLKLTYIQRVILVLNDKLELPTTRIAEVLKTLTEEEIREELHSAREILLIKFPDGKLAEFPEHGWAILNDCLMKLDKGIQQYLEDEVLEFISEYLQQSKSLLDGIFSKITPDDEIVDFLKEYLLKVSVNKKTKEDLTKFSNNYTSVSAKTTEVLFEKAFTSSKTTLSDINKNLAAIIPARRTKFRVALIIGFITIALSMYFYLSITENTWNVNKGDGIFKLNDNQNQIAELTEGDEISTTGNSNVEIINSNSSNIILLANSTLILNEVKANFTKFSLLNGSLAVNSIVPQKRGITSENKIIKIEANGVEVISQKGELIISSSKESGLVVNIESGFAELKLEKAIYYLAEDYVFIKKQNNKHTIPFRKNANYELIELIKAVNPQDIDKLTIMEIIKNSTRNDYLTLFNLLLISDISNRELILNKLNIFFPLETLFVWKNLVNLERNEINFLKDFLLENTF
ncbi:MAG: hypothetical protein L3J41_15045 [Melioribacteraceae bacterium]|nr:hypothetical protein [Melioribacteraceae bacterium]